MTITVRRTGAVMAASIGLMLCWSPVALGRDDVVLSSDGTQILTHFYPAAGLRAGERVPTVLVGSGYATPGSTNPDEVRGDGALGLGDLRAAGFNVVTWDPRGFGGSGGTSSFNHRDAEGQDVAALIDHVARQPEALRDAPTDPRIGMFGASFGGGIQFVAAAIDKRVDAIVPDMAWHSLRTSFAKDGAFKAGWVSQTCAFGATGRTDLGFKRMCSEGTSLGSLSDASMDYLTTRGPGALVSEITAPTLITQATPDTFFPLSEAIANFTLLRARNVPVKMLWYCGARIHGTCLTPEPPEVRVELGRAGLTWLRRWLKRDPMIDTGPRFQWVDDEGRLRSAADYPLPPAGTVSTTGAGSLTVPPSLSLALGPVVAGTPGVSVLELAYDAPPTETDIVGEPTLELTYRGIAAPPNTFLYAQVVDARAQRVVGGQTTPIPVTLDGHEHTITRNLEVIAIRGHRASDLRLQLVPSTTLYGPQRSVGSVTIDKGKLSSTLPLVNAQPAAP